MNFLITSLIRDNIKKMKKYASARDEFSGRAKIYLDANENTIGSPTNQTLNRYPDPLQKQLRKSIANYKNIISPEHVFLGNGSDEAIDLIVRAFCEPRIDSLMIMSPTYSMYTVCANINDVAVLDVPLKPNFSIDVDQVINIATEKQPKLIFICSPNNPSGNIFPEEDIEAVIRNTNSLIIIDEAYIDFSDTPSWNRKIATFPNLIVLQTFSKAWGMAGIRLGMAFSNTEVIAVLNKIKYPYNINDVTANIVLETIKYPERKEKMVKQIKVERQRLMKELKDISVVKDVLPSVANFFLARFDDPDAVYAYLSREGIIVRNRSRQLHCEGCLRITVGTREENSILCDALMQYKNKEQ